MQLAYYVVTQCVMDRAVFGQPRLSIKGCCANHHLPMTFARAVIAAVTSVQMAFIYHLKVFGR